MDAIEPQGRPAAPRPPTREQLARLRATGKRGLWAVPEALKEEVLAQLWELLADPTADDKDRIAAARVLGYLDKIDQDDDRRAPPADRPDARAALERAAAEVLAHGRRPGPDGGGPGGLPG